SPGRQLQVLDDAGAAEGAEEQEVASYSQAEVLRGKDFDTLTEVEMAEVRRLIRLMRLPAGLARSRRARPGGHDQLDMRRLLRRSLRFGGELLVFSWKSPTLRPRPLVLLGDISGAMGRPLPSSATAGTVAMRRRCGGPSRGCSDPATG